MSQYIILLLLSWTFAEHTSAFTLSKNSQYFEQNEWEEACRNETYCTIQSKHYPKQKIEALLNNMATIRSRGVMSSLSRHSRNSEYYFQVCLSDIDNSPIYEIIDSNGKVRYVVQSEKYFQQVLRLEKCRNPGMVTESVDYFYNPENDLFDLYCKEKRINYPFVVLSEDGSQFEWASVANGLPVVCYCHMEIKP